MTYDADAVRRAVRDLLAAVGEDPDREGLRDTPERMARAYAEMFSGLDEDPGAHVERAFDVGHSEMVLVRTSPCTPCASIICCPSTGPRMWPTSPVRTGG